MRSLYNPQIFAGNLGSTGHAVQIENLNNWGGFGLDHPWTGPSGFLGAASSFRETSPGFLKLRPDWLLGITGQVPCAASTRVLEYRVFLVKVFYQFLSVFQTLRWLSGILVLTRPFAFNKIS